MFICADKEVLFNCVRSGERMSVDTYDVRMRGRGEAVLRSVVVIESAGSVFSVVSKCVSEEISEL